MNSFIFLWLHNQKFYKQLQKEAINPIHSIPLTNKSWADIGCSTGLITRLAQKLNYKVIGYDINSFSLLIAKVLSCCLNNISYKQEDFHNLNQTFDIVSATSLLSVVDDKKVSFKKLLSLLKDTHSILIIIEPTTELSRKNVWLLIDNLKSFWFYKGLLLWAKARENKSISQEIFEQEKNITITHKYFLQKMIRVTYIQKIN